ncbi:type II toxin-antitoxin system RelE/ParE family toxin [Candidatus Thiosymbion oneisti]|uniref:type II toxin-antitoxin system RelE/ParE family toxin n=1 Tax=Candidatus Thiosymbion oneisti TaxID=589554 RepID=UPI00105C5BAB|nr:type II toxin-antitoxin system RelE/ParE family toxin [Candidatus Thiosymbion oneisti]
MKIRILASARRDLLDGFRFYEKQARGIGSYFLDSLYSDIESLLVNAGVHPLHFERYHRLLSKRFPFAVYYQVADDTILVYAVLDCRRDPAWIRNKLNG